MVIDLKRLKDIVRERVIDRVDHTNLNEDVDFLRGVIPTAENLARAFWQQLAPAITEASCTKSCCRRRRRTRCATGEKTNELRPGHDGPGRPDASADDRAR